MSYESTWWHICCNHGWDCCMDDPAMHRNDLSESEENALSNAFHAEFGEFEVYEVNDYDWQYGQPA